MTEHRRDSKRTSIPGIQPGQVITARWLNRVVSGVNENAEGLKRPASLQPIASVAQEFDATNDPETQEQPEGQLGTVWAEVSRSTSTVRISDPDTGASVDVARIDQVTFQSAGSILTLIFNNV